jgi:thioredoxin reductase (NADPH)
MTTEPHSGRPFIFVVDDDRASGEHIRRLLDRRLGADYAIEIETDADAGLKRLAQLRDEGAEVALILADQSMPSMAGVDFEAAAGELHPDARRAVMVGWGELETSREPILRAAARGDIETFIAKPWRDADEGFYHALAKFLEEWDRGHRPQLELIRIVGRRWDAHTQQMRDALHRSGVPFGFYDVDTDQGRELLAAAGVAGPLPVTIFQDGRALARPSPIEIASALGVNVDPAGKLFDLAVVGSGPAGLAAAVYGSSEGLKTLVIESEAFGGQASTSSMIRNYLGFPRGLSGADLAGRAYRQAWFFGASFVIGRSATELRVDGDERVIVLDDGSEVRTRAVILATGVSYRRLRSGNLDDMVGRGVFYGAPVAEAPGLAGEPVIVVGGGNSSAQMALYMSRFASRVTLVTRGEALNEMSDYLVREIEGRRNIEVRLNTVVSDAHGESRLETVRLRDTARAQEEEVPASGLFILIGAVPRTGWLPAELQRDERGYLLTGGSVDTELTGGRRPAALETSLPGVFAVGDVRLGSMKRIAAAVGEGSSAVRMVHDYFARLAAREAQKPSSQ